MKLIPILLRFSVLVILASCQSSEPVPIYRPVTWAHKIESKNLNNLYQIDSILYRSEQPDVKGMEELQRIGIKTVLDLRNIQNDNQEAKKTNLVLIHISINAWKISYTDVLEALRVIQNAQKPVLVHCLHGSDRTGCVVAAYRMVYQNWTKEQAIDELRSGGYDFHEKWFGNIIDLVNSLDVEKLKKDLGK